MVVETVARSPAVPAVAQALGSRTVPPGRLAPQISNVGPIGSR
jgi:hypothetical protein